MRLLDDVCLIESEVLAPPTARTFECSLIKLASYEHSISWTKLRNSSWEYDRKPSLEENLADFFGARFGQGRGQLQESEPVSVEHRQLSIADLMQLAIRIG